MKKTPENDLLRVGHMLDFAHQLAEYTLGQSRDDLNTNKLLALAPARLIELFGEAASWVSDESRIQTPQIPWRIIIDTRNRVIHGYDDIDLDQIWTTATNDIPSLIPAPEAILSAHDSNPSDQPQ